jgi:hypothetical protein
MSHSDKQRRADEPLPGDEIAPTSYRKRPVEIQAIRWSGRNLKQVIDFTGLHPSAEKWTWDEYEEVVRTKGFKLFSLEGPHIVSVGDYVIRGVKGEHYACKPDIFWLTYQRATTPSSASVPQGWKLVPVEPDDRMAMAGFQARSDKVEMDGYREPDGAASPHNACSIYRAMLAAAPSHELHTHGEGPCPDGDACPDARRYGSIHPAPSSSGTPRTEQLHRKLHPESALSSKDHYYGLGQDPIWELARQLERELAEAIDQRDTWERHAADMQPRLAAYDAARSAKGTPRTDVVLDDGWSGD